MHIYRPSGWKSLKWKNQFFTLETPTISNIAFNQNPNKKTIIDGISTFLPNSDASCTYPELIEIKSAFCTSDPPE